jgi:hypothetical protein
MVVVRVLEELSLCARLYASRISAELLSSDSRFHSLSADGQPFHFTWNSLLVADPRCPTMASTSNSSSPPTRSGGSGT